MDTGTSAVKTPVFTLTIMRASPATSAVALLGSDLREEMQRLIDFHSISIAIKEVKRMEVKYLQYHPIQMAYRVAQRLICLKYSSQDEDSIRQALQDLKGQYIDGRL
ncbi:dna mismatch repair protein msh4 [Quercus suber]|uniref:Dna mismatch repair protein msh4 n=1 Tax=Quercus suber TaxID=58331 RepID=A0AAW0M0C2_QUESU